MDVTDTKDELKQLIESKLDKKVKLIEEDVENYDISDLRDICQLNQLRDSIEKNSH